MSTGEVPQADAFPEDLDLGRVLGQIRDGDEAAARELLRRYEAEVRLVVRRQLPRLLRSRFDSLDFLQSVWGSFFKRVRGGPAEFEDSRHLVAFLARAAKNKVIDEYRRAASLKQDMHRERDTQPDRGGSRDIWPTARPRPGSAAGYPGPKSPGFVKPRDRGSARAFRANDPACPRGTPSTGRGTGGALR
jgi:hypothetical protein